MPYKTFSQVNGKNLLFFLRLFLFPLSFLRLLPLLALPTLAVRVNDDHIPDYSGALGALVIGDRLGNAILLDLSN